jgi:ABC-2 type transport system permease protein
MSVFATLFRKHLGESKWALGLCVSAFFGLSVLSIWLTLRAERLIASLDLSKGPRRLGIFRALGGPAMDFSTLALEVAFWNHPLIVLTVLGWAISRGSAAVAGEIDRGTLDLVLSRPVSRAKYLASHVAFAGFGLIMLAVALIAGNLVGNLFFAVKSPPGVRALLGPATMVVTLGLGAYGYTLPFSAIDIVRWRPGLIAAALTLVGLIAMTIAPQFEDYEWLLEKLSIFRAYAPVTVAIKGEPLAYNASVLVGVFAVGMVLSFVAFARRDLPANS